ncbi:ABC transporter ATP-binding protein [Kitasatospora saccharophila]|uniref:ABC transporter ATP-binding protein n=1 Tax=Kitasatospora saccharophila TaxID=407973 RepID=A0ABN2XDC7_9ACTN
MSRDDGVLLRAEGVALRYGTLPALHGVDVAVAAGTVTAVTGPSGSGKSSLLHCLAGVLRPTGGRVLFEGRDLAALSDRELSAVRARSFGFVFQFGDLVPELTLAENVALPLVLAGQRGRRARGPVLELLARLGIDHLADRRPALVSGGQAQRAAVARALVHRPAVLFADEPTGALDRAAGRLVLAELLALSAERGTAVVLVTHDETVAAAAGRRLDLVDGRLSAGAAR